MGFSFMHLVLTVVVIAVVFGPKPFHKVGIGAGEFWRSLKRGFEGKHDIDVTDSVKRIEKDDD